MRRTSSRCALAFGVIAIGAALIGDTMGFAQLGTNPKSALDAQRPEILWRAEVGFQPSDIKAGDITGDGRPDLVIGYYSTNADPASIVAIDSTGQILWRFQAGPVWNVAIGDINGDGINDVAGWGYVLGQPQPPQTFLYAIKHDGTLLWKVELPKAAAGAADLLKIADVTGNGRNEVIIAAPGTGTVSYFDKDGIILRSYSAPEIAQIRAIEVADLSADGVKDILISYNHRCPCGMRVIDGFGNLLGDFPSTVPLGRVAVGDIDNNGTPDVIVSESFGRSVSAISNLGSLLWSLPLQGAGLEGTVALGDIKGKGTLSVLAGSRGSVNLIDSNGTLLWTLDANANVAKVLFGQFTGGGKKEIAAATMSGDFGDMGGVLFLDSQGKVKRFLSGEQGRSTENKGCRVLVVADLDGDGIDEVVAVSEDGFAYALQMNGKR